LSQHRLLNKVFLVVDDDEQQVLLISKILQMIGAVRVSHATSGPEALELFRQTRIDFVITDLLMSPMDGFELSRRIRALPQLNAREVPIIVSTGYSSLVNVENARDAGVTEVLRKPYMPVDLFHRVLSILDKPREFVAASAFKGPDRRRHEDVPPLAGDRRYTEAETSILQA